MRGAEPACVMLLVCMIRLECCSGFAPLEFLLLRIFVLVFVDPNIKRPCWSSIVFVSLSLPPPQYCELVYWTGSSITSVSEHSCELCGHLSGSCWIHLPVNQLALYRDVGSGFQGYRRPREGTSFKMVLRKGLEDGRRS